jgi:hypothetical protein
MFGDKRKNNGGARKGAGRKPGGSNRSTAEFRNYARTFTPEAVDMFVAVMRDEDADIRLRLKAARWLVERGYGKASKQIFGPEESERTRDNSQDPKSDAATVGRQPL